MDMFKSSNGMELAPSVVQARVYLHILGKTMRPVEVSTDPSVGMLLPIYFGVFPYLSENLVRM